jgi:hypothetical protein
MAQFVHRTVASTKLTAMHMPTTFHAETFDQVGNRVGRRPLGNAKVANAGTLLNFYRNAGSKPA